MSPECTKRNPSQSDAVRQMSVLCCYYLIVGVVVHRCLVDQCRVVGFTYLRLHIICVTALFTRVVVMYIHIYYMNLLLVAGGDGVTGRLRGRVETITIKT